MQLLPIGNKKELIEAILKGILPKFIRVRDNVDGLGLAVRATWVTHIIIETLSLDNKETFTTTVQYKTRNRFGLDDKDIRNFLPVGLIFSEFCLRSSGTINSL